MASVIDLEMEGLRRLEGAATEWQRRLQRALSGSMRSSRENLGQLEERLVEESRELQRTVLEEAAQKKADAAPPDCPVCGRKLTQRSSHERRFTTRFGEIAVNRLRGYCKHCKAWRTPADTALGVEESAGYSPAVQEMAALLERLRAGEGVPVIEDLRALLD